MADFVTLTCPSCGGKLQVTPDLDRFACGYCGQEHVVRRGGGIVSLSPVVEGLQQVRAGVDRTASELAIRRLKGEIPALQRRRPGEIEAVQSKRDRAIVDLQRQREEEIAGIWRQRPTPPEKPHGQVALTVIGSMMSVWGLIVVLSFLLSFSAPTGLFGMALLAAGALILSLCRKRDSQEAATYASALSGFQQQSAQFDSRLAIQTADLDNRIAARTAELDGQVAARATELDSQIAAKTAELERHQLIVSGE